MKRQLYASIGVATLLAIAVAFPSVSRGESPPPIGGGYTEVIAIAVNDPAVKAIGAALFKPAGAGAFPAVVYMPGCGGIDSPVNRELQKTLTDHLLAKGIAVLIVDPYTPRNEPKGVCANLGNLDGESAMRYATRGSNDALAATAALKAMPEIDAKHIFLAGFSLGGTSSLLATDTKNPVSHGAAVAGVIAHYPFCYDGVDSVAPVLVLIGEKDDWTPAEKCQAVTGKSNFDLVVYPGITHAFMSPFPQPTDVLGHHLVYDETSARDAQRRSDAFLAAHIK
jgi:dienelactone hydrolase